MMRKVTRRIHCRKCGRGMLANDSEESDICRRCREETV